MPTATFFGHKDAPDCLLPALISAIRTLILSRHVTCFYVGNHGRFDAMTHTALRLLSEQYPHIEYYTVLAYLPQQEEGEPPADSPDGQTVYPEGIELTPPRFAISYRNKWMISQSDYAVTYVQYSFGGAAKFKALAERRGLTVIELADDLAADRANHTDGGNQSEYSAEPYPCDSTEPRP